MICLPPKSSSSHIKSTRYKMQQRAKKLRPQVLKVRAKIPWVFGDNTYVYAAIAAHDGVLRETDIDASLGRGAVVSLRQPDREALGIVQRFELQRQPKKTGKPGYAVIFDKKFPLAKPVIALARKIGQCHPLPIDNMMTKEIPPPPPPRKYNVDLLAGSEVNTMILAAARALRGNSTRAELIASVPHGSTTAVENAVQRLIDYGILDPNGTQGIYFARAPWLLQLERLYDAYLRVRPAFRDQARKRLKLKKQRRDERPIQNLFGFAVEERILQTLAVNGPMKRTELAAITMLTHKDTILTPLVDAGIVAIKEELGESGKGTKAHGARKRIVVSLNAAFPVYRELRALLLALADKPNTKVQDLLADEPGDGFNPEMIFNTPAMLKTLLLTNAIRQQELDAASLKRLKPEHPVQVIHGRMHWLRDEGIITVRPEGLVRYYRLNPAYKAYKPLRRLLDRIAVVWPETVEAATMNEDLKPEWRRRRDRGARRRKAKASRTSR